MPVTIYATPEDFFTLGLRRDACKEFTPAQIELALNRASREMDGYLRNRYTLPFVSVDEAMATTCCDIAAYRLLKPRGFRPESADGIYVAAYKDALVWLGKVRDKLVTPLVVDSSTGATPGSSSYGRPRVVTASDRGHTTRQGDDARGPGHFLVD
jgi:phage gp36-like protein